MIGRRLLAVLFGIVIVAAWATPAAAREPIVVGTGPVYTPLGPEDIESRADLTRFRPFSPAPFRVASYSLRTLEWAALPLNGRSLPKLAPPPGADPDGIPYKIVNGKRYYSPGNIASDGIRFVDGYVRTGDPAYLSRARVRAARLVAIGIAKDGALYLPYDFDYPTESLHAPWVSAYSQGLALSFLVRLFRVTGEWRYADTARSIFAAFRLLGTRRVHWVAYVLSSDLWLEEYPSARPSHVLNGFNFAIFGLYDYERLTRDPAATQLVEAALSTMRRHAIDYRVPGGISYYDLTHRTQFAHYHEIHIWQLAALGAISGDAYFTKLSATLRADYSG
jgi:D-glucuronyl C5-epimerase C-terminus